MSFEFREGDRVMTPGGLGTVIDFADGLYGRRYMHVLMDSLVCGYPTTVYDLHKVSPTVSTEIIHALRTRVR